MKDKMAEIFDKGLDGHMTHVNTMHALEGLTHEIASQRPAGDLFSSWEILYHMVFWQNVILDTLRGENVDWEEAQKHDWPSYAKEDVKEWTGLKEEFEKGLKKARKLLNEVDLNRPLPSWGGATFAKTFMVLAQHNSYHLGQIVMNRKAQGSWPPPKKD